MQVSHDERSPEFVQSSHGKRVWLGEVEPSRQDMLASDSSRARALIYPDVARLSLSAGNPGLVEATRISSRCRNLLRGIGYYELKGTTSVLVFGEKIRWWSVGLQPLAADGTTPDRPRSLARLDDFPRFSSPSSLVVAQASRFLLRGCPFACALPMLVLISHLS